MYIYIKLFRDYIKYSNIMSNKKKSKKKCGKNNEDDNNNKSINDKYRTQEERRAEILPIIHKLTELTLTTEYDEIKELYKLFQRYIVHGERIEIKINFPAIKRRIIGILAIHKREQVWVKLEMLQ